MTQYDYDLFTIGAGSGGVRASRYAARLGARVAVAEERYLGGTCVNVGCIPKKLFSYAAHYGEDIGHAAGYGWRVPPPAFDWPTLVANKDRLAKTGYKMPESWKDLLDPKWKGEIIMPSPLSSGTANMMRFSFLALYGDTEGWKFIEALDKNIAFYTRSGNAPTDLVGRGEFTLGITSDENVKKRLDDGYPLLWTIPKEGTGYDGTSALILKGTKKLDAAKKIVDLLGTPEFSALMAEIGYMTPRPAANALYGKTLPKYIKLDLGSAADDKAKNNDVWKAKLRTDFK